MERTVCGAKTRKGTPCQKAGLKNGRCRLHGGSSTGPKDREKKSQQMKGNKNALKTGEYETITYDTLSEAEKELYELIPEDVEKQAKGRYKLVEIRTHRLMTRYMRELEKKKPDTKAINQLEEILIKLDSRAVDLIRLRKELDSKHTGSDVSSIDTLNIILDKARIQHYGK